ncbi:sulfatase [bacterium]|nr:sulfatase [bacterium]
MKPNILHLTWHDVGRFLNCYGRKELVTPHIDQLAADGMRFTNYWATSAVCSPSRACALTGRYPQAIGVIGLCHAPENYSLNAGERHLSHILRDAGWHTCLVGWQHETTHDKVRDSLGFQEIHLNDPLPPCDVVATRVVEWLRAHAQRQDKPFYLQAGFFEVHRPHTFGGVKPDAERGVYQPPFLADSPRARAELAQQQGMIRKADECAGVIFTALRELALDDNTIVIFTSDHGVEFPRAKATLYDPGIEIPLIIRWPKRGIAGGTVCDALLSNVDYLPTLLDLVDLPKPANLHGQSFSGVFPRFPRTPARDEIHATFLSSHRAIRTRTHKLIWNISPHAALAVPVLMERPQRMPAWAPWELYDLQQDPLESANLSSVRPFTHAGSSSDELAHHRTGAERAALEIEAGMKQRLWAWMERIDDYILHGPERTPYYDRAMKEYLDTRSK